ncbi:zinc-binding dehydrogenase [Bythopirellula polymerisocia]|uniref:D-arabitol-phosphate dehydrogenase n=1 Tax=Bythopirellula polymerisocia TaxID=2528003 RepID=A0A5C6CC29_9BACT|nr:alcohol dehydrogenase catalytic domain-containing protein [Bythopirellula polymerisocia]TWU21387.1 D-arabitol-phosphate dehydrogenase [Bythopirellula polymerisocia]
MKAARYTQGESLCFEDVPLPDIDSDEMLIRVEATSICGTDTKIMRHGHRKLHDGQTITLGHEFVGRIEKLGARVSGFLEEMFVGVAPNIGCGTCDMCSRRLMNMCQTYSAFGVDRDGSHATHVRIPSAAIAQGNVIEIADSVTPLDATLAEPLSCVVNAAQATRVKESDQILIYGAGPMGLLHLMLANVLGASEVIMVDPNATRLELATKVGASTVLNPNLVSVPDWVSEFTQGRGLDVVMTAAPVAALQQEGLSLLAPFGRLCLFAGLPRGAEGVRLDTNAIHYKNLYVTGVTGGSPVDYRAAIELISSGKIPVSEIVSDVFPLSELELAYESATNGSAMKVAILEERLFEKSSARQSQASQNTTACQAAGRA